MTVEIPVVITSKKTGLDQVGKDAKALNDKLNAQAKERLRIIDLQAQKERTTDAVKRRSLQAEIATRRRSLQITRIKEQAERANTRELRQQIAAQKRLNSLTRKLNKDLDAQQQKRTLLGRAQGASERFGGIGGGALALGGVGIAAAGATAAASATFEFAKASEELARQNLASEKRLFSIVRTSDEYNKLITEVKANTLGMITETEAAEAAFILLDSRLAENNQEAAQLVSTGTILTQVYAAQGASIEKFNKFLGSGSAALADNFNLTNEQINARSKLIETTDGLADGEGRLIAIKELLNEKADELRDTLDDASISVAAFDAASNDLQSTIGEFLTPSFTAGRQEVASYFETLDNGLTTLTEFNKVTAQLKDTQDEANRTWANTFDTLINGLPIFGTLKKIAAPDLFFGATTSTEDFAEAQRQLDEELAGNERALNSNTTAIENNSEAQEEAAKRLEEINDTRRGLANNLLDIEEKAQEQSTESRRAHFDGVLSATEDFTSQLKSIESDAAKESLSIQGKLQKDLRQVDKGLFQDKVKLAGEAKKRIKRLEEDTARKTKTEERSRRIDTLGDERLFQFELRQLAADGEALQIQEAIDRRKIEQEIGKQKRSEEERTEGDDLQVKIQRIKNDTQDRIRQERAQARERSNFLEEQATQDLDALNAELALKKEAEVENLGERLNALKEANRERLANIDETRQEEMAKLGETLVRAKDLTQQELEAMIPIAEKAGKDAGAAFAAGLETGFTRLQEVEGLTGGRQFGQAAPRPGFGQGARPGAIPGFANGVTNFQGGLALVGERGPEVVTLPRGSDVTPNGQAPFTINVPVTVNGSTNAAQVEAIVNRSVQGLIRDLEAMLGA